MDLNSLQWLLEDFNWPNHDEEIDDGFLDTIKGDNSDTSSDSDSNIDCLLVTGDKRTAEDPDNIFENIIKNVPESYTKTSNIEKVILLFANNFIEQFKVKYPNRRPLVLIPQNECGVQKCVCTTIKPARLIYCDLIGHTSYSQFVANYITYVKLDDPMTLPNKIVSPATTLKIQTANCFQLAILLVSFLIGCGYNAYIVYGYATEIVCNNDLRAIKIDLPKESTDEQKSVSKSMDDLDDPYAVEPMIDLCNEYVDFLMEVEKNKIAVVDEVKEIDLDNSPDPLFGKRVHAWVMIMPLKTEGNDDKSEINEFPYFIEPSTGEKKEISDENYIGIEVVWNNTNYWVNLQSLVGGCMHYNFDLMNTEYWEHFLPDKPQSLQKEINNLEMPNSWVTVLEVPRNKYTLLYPNGKKIVSYMNAIKEFYAGFVMPDGLVKRTTFYSEPEYLNKIFVQEVYKNRIDKLICIDTKYTGEETETIEYFRPGRGDNLKKYKYYGDCNNMDTKRLFTFYERLDAMVDLKMSENSFITTYNDRSDLLFWHLCVFHQSQSNNTQSVYSERKPKCVVEKYLRDESKHKDQDIATITLNIDSNNIYVQYQYGEGQITQSSRLFQKPTYSSIINEKFDPESVIEDMVYPFVGNLKAHEAYMMLQEMIETEKKALDYVSKLEKNVIQMLETRLQEHSAKLKLKVESMDWDRNHVIRELLQEKKENKHKFTIKNTNASNMRDKIIQHFRKNTKNQYIEIKQLTETKQLELQSLTKSKESNDPEVKARKSIMCSSLKNELNVLALQLVRYKESRIKRYNNLATSLNSNPDYKMLPPLKLFVYEQRDIK